jgi:hypothetical protein
LTRNSIDAIFIKQVIVSHINGPINLFTGGMHMFGMSFSGITLVDDDRLYMYKLVPISPEQAIPDQVVVDEMPDHLPGTPVVFAKVGGGTSTLVALTNGNYRERSTKEKQNADTGTTN